MVKSNCIILILTLLASSCASISHRTLPIVSTVSPEAKKKTVLVEFTDLTLDERSKQFISTHLEDSGLFERIFYDEAFIGKDLTVNSKINEIFPVSQKPKNWDLKLRVAYTNWGFFEPYCWVFLELLPCTPPLNAAIGVQAISPEGKVLGTYFVKETATEVQWLFASTGKLEAEFYNNMFNNILSQMRADHIL